MLAALYLLSMLLIWVVPKLFSGQAVEPVIALLVRYGLPLAARRDHARSRVPAQRPQAPVGVDLFYSVLLFLLVVALVLGSFVVRDVSHGHYVTALAQTLLGIAGAARGAVVAVVSAQRVRGRGLSAVELSHEPRPAFRALGARAATR